MSSPVHNQKLSWPLVFLIFVLLVVRKTTALVGSIPDLYSGSIMPMIDKEATEVMDLDGLLKPCRAMVQQTQGGPRSLAWRREQLLIMKQMLEENKDELCDALHKDMGKSRYEGIMSEISIILSELKVLLRLLPQYADGKAVKVSSPGFLFPNYAKYTFEPLTMGSKDRCANLVIGPFNYPIQLSLIPSIGSLAAGNPTILKPSEMCPETSRVMKALVDRYYSETNALQVVEGGVDVTTQLLKHSWGKIFFTGSTRVGKIVATAAAQTLTPSVLELGGKSPVYIDKNTPNMRSMVDRIMWGKTLNAGQTCVAPDYILCHHSVMDSFCNELVNALERMFGEKPQDSVDLARIVSKTSAERLISYISEAESTTGCKVLTGGSKLCNAEEKYVAPTIIIEPPSDLKLWKEELFGPILPIKSVMSQEDAISFINDMPGTPLALYVFTSSGETFETFGKSCPSGALVRNDVVIHFPSNFMPIGGLGTSGWGNHHGKFSIETFSHSRATNFKPCHPILDYAGLRFAPHFPWKQRAMIFLLNLPPVPPLKTVALQGAAVTILSILALRQIRSEAMVEVVASTLVRLANYIRHNRS